MNFIEVLILVFVLDAIILISGYIIAMHYYPEGCCKSLGSYIMLGYMLSVIPITLYVLLREVLK